MLCLDSLQQANEAPQAVKSDNGLSGGAYLARLVVDLKGQLTGWGQHQGEGELLTAAIFPVLLLREKDINVKQSYANNEPCHCKPITYPLGLLRYLLSTHETNSM